MESYVSRTRAPFDPVNNAPKSNVSFPDGLVHDHNKSPHWSRCSHRSLLDFLINRWILRQPSEPALEACVVYVLLLKSRASQATVTVVLCAFMVCLVVSRTKVFFDPVSTAPI